MFYASRWSSWTLLILLCSGCGGSSITLPAPRPSSSSLPPNVTGKGTLAVINVADPKSKTVLIFRPHSDVVTRQIIIPGAHFHPNSLAFDKRGHLYIGINDSQFPAEYRVLEYDVETLQQIREIRKLPYWPHSSVATDGENYLYVNTKAFVGGDIKMYRPNTETKPFLEIKDQNSPLTTFIARGSLWVGEEGLLYDRLGRYALRSTNRTWDKSIASNQPKALAINPDSSLIAALVQRTLSPRREVDVFDIHSKKHFATIASANNLQAMTSDAGNNIYISESNPGRVFHCDYHACSTYFATNSNNPIALAVSPLDGNLYVANRDAGNIEVYRTDTKQPIMKIAPPKFEPTVLAIEP